MSFVCQLAKAGSITRPPLLLYGRYLVQCLPEAAARLGMQAASNLQHSALAEVSQLRVLVVGRNVTCGYLSTVGMIVGPHPHYIYDHM